MVPKADQEDASDDNAQGGSQHALCHLQVQFSGIIMHLCILLEVYTIQDCSKSGPKSGP